MATRRTLGISTKWTLIAAAGILLAAGTASAGTIVTDVTTEDGSGADSFVQKGNATTNYGTAASITVKDAGTGTTTRKGYVRFDLTTLPLTDVVHTELSLVVSGNSSGGGNPPPNQYFLSVYGLDDGNAGEGWGETTINWNNAPANNTSNNGVLTSDATLLGQFRVPALAAPQTVSLAGGGLTRFLQADTDGQATFLIVRNGGGGGNNLSFAPKEHASLAAPSLATETHDSLTTLLTADADSYVRLGQPTNNFGAADQVVVKNSGGGSTTRKGYIRFDISDAPLWQTIDAELLLDIGTNNQGGGSTSPASFTVNLYGLDDDQGADAWDESAINWNDAPANASGNSINTGQATLLGTFNVTTDDMLGNTVAFANADSNSPDGLLDFLRADTDGLVTFILTRGTGSGSYNLGFASLEHATFAAPRLLLTTVPEPSSALLLLIGTLAACGAFRRRRRVRA